MIRTRRLRDLEVSAASGLVAAGDALYVVGDDELDLFVYSADGSRLLGRRPLFPGEGRPGKREKPDLEAICAFRGGLLALGSGSRANRMRGVLLPEGPAGPAEILDLAPLYQRLAAELPELNVEGAALVEGTLRLLQRGNGAARVNAVIDLDAAGFPAREAVRGIRRVALGEHQGVPWSFTDASPLPDGRLLFAAAAEDTDDPFEDGPVVGAALGILDAGGRVASLELLDVTLKVEGVHAFPSGEALLVADADAPGAPSPLLATRWS